ATNSPATPRTMRNHPTETTSFAQAGIWRSGLSECSSCRIAFMLSRYISGSSNNSPATTTPVDTSSQLKQEFRKDSKLDLIRSSTPCRTSGLVISGETIDNEDQQTDGLITFLKFWILMA